MCSSYKEREFQIMSNPRRISFNCVVVVEQIHRMCTHYNCLKRWKYQKNPRDELKSFWVLVLEKKSMTTISNLQNLGV
jgi:hypothetical protein